MVDTGFLPTALRRQMNDATELGIYDDLRVDQTQQSLAALRVPSTWDNQRLQMRPKKSADLEALLGIYDKHKKTSDFNVLTCTWDDVIEQMQEAQRQYEQKGKKGGVIRGFFRHGKSAKMLLSPLLEVIPEDYGLNALKGGLGLLFHCLAQRQENVDKILKCFEDIPLLMENAEEILDIFYDNKRLGDHIWTFYDALLIGVPQLISILLHKSDEKWWKKVLRTLPSQQERIITEVLSSIEIAKKRLMDYAEHIGYRTTVNIEQMTAKTLEGVTEIKLNIGEMSRNMRQGLNGVMQAMLYINKRIDELSDEQGRVVSMITELSQPNLYIQAVQTALYHLGQELFFQRKLLPAPSPRPRTPLAYRSSSNSGHVSGLLRLLGPRPPGHQDHLHASLDLMAILRNKYEFDDDSIGRSRWLLTSPQFRDWMAVPTSGALVAHSYGELATDGRTSAMSVLCATLTSALLRQGDSIVLLHFFCGLHADEEDGFSGPIGMVRSLIMQLLLSKAVPEPDLEFTTNSGLMDDLDDGVPKALLHVLEQLITQIPPGTRVYCLLDAPGVYDTLRNGWEEDLRLVFGLLRQLVYDSSLAPIFKLLVTTPFRSDVILEEVAPPRGTRYQDPRVDLSVGQIDRRPLTEEAIIADIGTIEDEVIVSPSYY